VSERELIPDESVLFMRSIFADEAGGTLQPWQQAIAPVVLR